MCFQKQNPKIITYWKYKTFDNEKFRPEVLKQNFDQNDFGIYKDFNLFKKHVPLKEKYVRVNEAYLMTKEVKINYKEVKVLQYFLER